MFVRMVLLFFRSADVYIWIDSDAGSKSLKSLTLNSMSWRSVPVHSRPSCCSEQHQTFSTAMKQFIGFPVWATVKHPATAVCNSRSAPVSHSGSRRMRFDAGENVFNRLSDGDRWDSFVVMKAIVWFIYEHSCTNSHDCYYVVCLILESSRLMHSSPFRTRRMRAQAKSNTRFIFSRWFINTQGNREKWRRERDTQDKKKEYFLGLSDMPQNKHLTMSDQV